ncbi:MAG TPA: Ig-like domain-containing protein, partial [Verrucomicrobiae bacterium]
MKDTHSNHRVNRSWLRHLGTVSLGIIVPALLAFNAGAALIAYDPMNYTGAQVNTGTAAPTGTPNQITGTGGGFSGNWSGGALTLNTFGVGYPNLPVAAKSISNLGANNLYTHIVGAPTTGSVWVSFLFKQTGDNGGNRSGVILENSAGVGVMLAYQQVGATQGKPCLMAMSSPTTVGAQLGTSANLQTYANTNLYVLQFTYTAGVVSSVSVYSNPTANQTTAPTADFTVSTGLPSFGALVDFGLYDGSAMGITLDEFRVGTSFGDVVGVSVVPVNVSITAPTNNQTVSVYNFNVNASATVVPGSITNVAFYLDSVVATNLTNSPFTFTANGVSAGAHTLVAVATDSSANSATSSVVNITAADLPPSVTLTNPAGGSQILVGSIVALGAAATDDGSVANVGFYVDGVLVGNASASPFSANWTATAGAHALTAIATDSIGQNATSAVVNVTGTLPAVSITSPTNNQAVSIYTFNMTANATVSPGTITNVDFYLDATYFASKTSSPYTIAVAGASAGAHTLQAVAMDINGNAVTSSVINVSAADLPPSVTITNPVNGNQFLSGSTVTLGASAADDGGVVNVGFYVDGVLAGNSTASPYAFAWVATPGAHVLTAVATDTASLNTTSAVVNVTGTLPAVSITTPTNNQTVSVYNFSVTSIATVSPGTITNVTLYLDSVFATNKTSSPYTVTLSNTPAGAHTLQAVA